MPRMKSMAGVIKIRRFGHRPVKVVTVAFWFEAGRLQWAC